jgi:hypothetical protein
MAQILKPNNPLIPFCLILLSVFIPELREIKFTFAFVALMLSLYQMLYFLRYRNNPSVFEILVSLSLNFLVFLYSIFMIILALFWR